MADNPVIGHENCIFCESFGRGEVINPVKLNKNGCGYCFCSVCKGKIQYNKADTTVKFLTKKQEVNYGAEEVKTPQVTTIDGGGTCEPVDTDRQQRTKTAFEL